jgi:cation:H+ antiporter
MVLIIASLLAGPALLTLGAEGLVRGSSVLPLRLGGSPLVVGLTIVAFGTSMPEMVVSSKAALDGYGGIAIGNVVGSNLFNILAILALSSLLAPLHGSGISMVDVYVMLGTAVVLLPFMRTGFTLNR